MAAPTPNDALSYAKRFMGNMPLDDATIKYRILDDAHRKLWMAAAWPWTVAPLEVVTLSNDNQTVDLVSTYSDFLCLEHAALTNGQEKNDLSISSSLPTTTVIKGRPTQVMYVAGTPQKLRFLPMPSGYGTAPKVLAVYKKKGTEISASNAGTSYFTTTGVHDDWFWVYQEIVLLKAFQFTHDPRLGSVTVGPNGAQYTGQYAAVEAGIAAMRAVEERFFTTLGEPVNG